MNNSMLYGKSFAEIWQNRAAVCPDNIFLIDEQNPSGYTYSQTDEISARVYGYLKKNGIKKGDFVLICLPRSAAVFISVIGILKNGSAFTIMEDHYPRERIEYIKADCGCKLEINEEVWHEILKEEPLAGYEKTELHDSAFALYTSGSTGFPKGVLHEYGNINRMMFCVQFPKKEEEVFRFALIAPLNFVASLIAFFAIARGAADAISVVPYSIVKNPVRLYAYIATNRITHMFLSPSYLRATHCMKGSGLQMILTGSEPANGIYSEEIPIANIYCMSESGFAITAFMIDKAYDNCPVGVGDGITHQVMLMGENGKTITAPGEMGEICYTNEYVRGYIGLPEQTEAAFKDGVFHSGDLGRYDENGNLIYAGRSNDMIKINGNRIEPAEIEAAGKEALNVSWCAAKGFVTEKQSFICLYYKDDVTFDETQVREKMEERLPYYMIPSFFIKIDEIPLLPTGKFDRKSLPAPQKKESVRPAYKAPQTDTEKLLCDTFAKVLELEKVGVDEDFFSLGGDSVKSMEVAAEINSDFLTAGEIFKGRTAEKIAALILEKEKDHAASAPADDIELRKGSYVLTEVQKKYLAEMERESGKCSALLARLIEFPVSADSQRLCDAINQMLQNRPAFGTVFFKEEDGTVKQKYDPQAVPKVCVERLSEADFEKIKHELIKPFTPYHSPFGIARVFETETRIYLLLGISHVMMDGTGERIYLNDVIKAYLGIRLPQDTFYTFLSVNEKAPQDSSFENAKNYYLEKYGKTKWLRCLPGDLEGSDHDRVMLRQALSFTPAQIRDTVKRHDVSLNVFFAAAVLLAAAQYTAKSHVLMNWTWQNRNAKADENAAGILMKRLPLGLTAEGTSALADLYADLKAQIINGIANSSYEWVSLTESGLEDETMSFVYQPEGMIDTKELSALGARIVSNVLPNPGTARRLAFMVFEYSGKTFGLVNYMKGFYSEGYIAGFYRCFEKTLEAMMNTKDPAALKLEELRTI